MADPKFQFLPWIAHDQPDVYETPDVQVSEPTDFYVEETKNEFIERPHINTKISYNRFKGKYLTGDVDFSDRLGKKLRTGYDARSGDWELAGEGEKETPIQKCRRLQCEMQDLMEEITIIQSDNSVSKEEKDSYDAVSNVVSTAKKVLESLKLEQVLGKESNANASDGEIKKLLSQVEDYKKSAAGDASVLSASIRNADLANSTRIAELEHRLHQLESVLGAKPEKVSRLSGFLGTNSLLEAVQQLSTKAALLQPPQLDLIEARLSNLTSKLDAIAEKSSGSILDSSREQKINELYDMAKSTETIMQILPDMLDRMQTLESLHKYATNLTKLFAELEVTQNNIISGVANNKNLLQSVQEAFAQNLENTNGEMKKLDDRMKTVAALKK